MGPRVWEYFWIPSQELMDPAYVWEPSQWELFSYMLTYPINIVQSPIEAEQHSSFRLKKTPTLYYVG